MSLLSGNPVSAKIKVVENSRIMFMLGNNFRMILNRHPSLQMYFARLLVKRLARSNVEISKQLSSGMAGNLSEITPAELFQTLNMTQKTGVIDLNLSKGKARVWFREGELVKAEYHNMIGEDAFFEILNQNRGSFKSHR